jgi:hypothetical protein
VRISSNAQGIPSAAAAAHGEHKERIDKHDGRLDH